VYITAMINHVFISFFAVQICDLPYVHLQHWYKMVNRRIRLTCLHHCCHPIQIMWLFIWEVTIVLFIHSYAVRYLWQIAQLQLPNESSRGLNWAATKM